MHQTLPHAPFHIVQHIVFLKTGCHLYVISDVYGFGVVLIEIMTGLRALDAKRPSGPHNFVYYLKPLLSQERNLMSIMDARMRDHYSLKAALQATQLTLKCLEIDPGNQLQ
ncbi:Protein kinase superfamily protein [Abeliophyllum distichum]|uniref:Protein kinase superfamily protein n=1 Tax=Abeliophyllum distichum TaxID=126358 RepID=A0ABD1V1P2_9LAMI